MGNFLKCNYFRTVGLLILFLAAGITSTFAQYKLKVAGDVKEVLELSLEDLSKFPLKDAKLTDKDGKVHTYRGVSILDILQKAGVPSGKDLRGEQLSKYLLVKCKDGYQILFSLAELDPPIADKNVILAYQIDGEKLAEDRGPLRLIAEGEKKPARSSYQVEALILGSVKD